MDVVEGHGMQTLQLVVPEVPVKEKEQTIILARDCILPGVTHLGYDTRLPAHFTGRSPAVTAKGAIICLAFAQRGSESKPHFVCVALGGLCGRREDHSRAERLLKLGPPLPTVSWARVKGL